MCRRTGRLIFLVSILCSHRVSAQEPVPAQAPATPYAPTPYAAPAPLLAPPAPTPAPPGGAILVEPTTKVEHLLKAAEHLDAAGLNHLAAHARSEATRLQQELTHKRAELQRLQGEVKKLTGEQRDQMLVKVKVVELNLTKARALGFDFKAVERNSECPVASTIKDGELGSPTGKESLSFHACDPQGINGFVNALVAENIAKVVAEPVMATVDGRPASIFVDGEIPDGLVDPAMLNPPRRAGTEIDISPQIVGSDRVRLQVRAQVTTIDPSLARNNILGFRHRAFDTGFDVDFGKTMVVQGLVHLRKLASSPEKANGAEASANEAILTMILLTPELVVAAAPQSITR